MSTRRLRFLLIPLIVLIVLAGGTSVAATVTMDESIGKRSRHSLERFMDIHCKGICSGLEEK